MTDTRAHGDAKVRIGIFQLNYHPAVSIDDIDLLQEPQIPDSPARAVACIARSAPELRATLKKAGQDYFKWHSSRMEDLLAWLRGKPRRPEILLFSECAIPLPGLQPLRSFAAEMGVLIFAGTHTPRNDEDGLSLYQAAGVRRGVRTQILQQATLPPAVLPLTDGKDTLLYPKLAPSIFELTDLRRQAANPLPVRTYFMRSLRKRIAPFVCAEALRLPQYTTAVDLAVLIAYERRPERFNSHIELLLSNQIPVAFANSAAYGGSGVFARKDSRVGRWWFDPPNNGRLDTGEYYLEIEIDFSATAVQSGVSNPDVCTRLIQLSPIVYRASDTEALENRARDAAQRRDQSDLQRFTSEFAGAAGLPGLLSRRWRYVLSLLEQGTLTADHLEMVGRSVPCRGMDLAALEMSLSKTVADGVDALLGSPRSRDLDDTAYGALSRLVRNLKDRSSDGPVELRPSGPRPLKVTAIPIDRGDLIAELRRTFTTPEVVLVTGLEAAGKTTVIEAALSQAGLRVLHLPCPDGASADYIYEYLLKSVGCVPPGIAPRQRFDVDDLTDALSRVQVLWIEYAHNLLTDREWRTDGIEQLTTALVEAASRACCCLTFESRRALPLRAGLGKQPIRRRVSGLQGKDAVDFLNQQLRRAGLQPSYVTQEQKEAIVRLVDGHPGLLRLCADACASTEVEQVLRDLRGRRGFLMGAVRKLLEGIALSPGARRCAAALTECRVPVPPRALNAIVDEPTRVEAIRELLDACLVEQRGCGRMRLISLLQDVDSLGPLTPEEKKAFHGELSKLFAANAGRDDPASAYLDAVEANYHATMAGMEVPCDVGGILDALTSVARRELDLQHYSRIIELLEPILLSASAPGLSEGAEELAAILAQALFWCSRFDEAFVLAERVVHRSRRHSYLYYEGFRAAFRAGHMEYAKHALEGAESVRPGFYRIPLMRGQLAERAGDQPAAVGQFKQAATAGESQGDIWPYFYLARALIRGGEPEEALKEIGRARELVEERAGRGARNLENALISQELLALVLTEDIDAARQILDALRGLPDLRPEAIVCAAFVDAFITESFGISEAVESFDDALKRLRPSDSRKDHVRAQIYLLRAKLLQAKGDDCRAEDEYEHSLRLDPHNLHSKRSLLRVLLRNAAQAKDKGFWPRMADIATRARELSSQILKNAPRDSEALAAIHMLEREYRS